MAPPTSFAEATALKQTSPHTYEANLPEEWCIGSVPQGGFVTGLTLQVAALHFKTTLSSQNQPHTIALHLDFLRRTEVGPALFTVQDIKLGRQASVIRITLTQGSGGREEIIGSITNGNIPVEEGPSFPTTWKLNPAPVPCDLSLLAANKDPNWVKQPEMPHADFRRATQRIEFYFPRAGQKSRSWADEWVRLSSPGERWTNASIGFAADMWPMPVESHSYPHNPYDPNTWLQNLNAGFKPPKYWYPTLLLNLDVKKLLPEEGVEWLFVRVDTKVIKNGRIDIEVIIMDEGYEIVALSHHIGFAVDAERNLAERKTGASKI